MSSCTARAAVLLLCAALIGCATRPADADYRTLAIGLPPAGADQPAHRTKSDVAASSAVKGGLGGFGVGAAICAAVVPYALPACAVALAPTTVTTGAVAGGLIGGTVARNTEPAPAELAARLDTAASQQRMVELLQQRAVQLAGASGQPAAAQAPSPESAPAYRLTVQLADLRMQQVRPGRPTRLVLLAQVSIQRSGDESPVWSRNYRVIGTERRTVAEWAQRPGAESIDELLQVLAQRLAPMLSPQKA